MEENITYLELASDIQKKLESTSDDMDSIKEDMASSIEKLALYYDGTGEDNSSIIGRITFYCHYNKGEGLFETEINSDYFNTHDFEDDVELSIAKGAPETYWMPMYNSDEWKAEDILEIAEGNPLYAVLEKVLKNY